MRYHAQYIDGENDKRIFKDVDRMNLIQESPLPLCTLPSFNAPRQKAGRKKNLRKADCSFPTLFPFYSGIVLTKKSPVALVDIFPLEGRGSLRFTLCD